MELTDKYQERLDLLPSAKNGYTDGGGPSTHTDKHTVVYYKPAEVKVIRKAAKYMGLIADPILSRPAVGYRILSHMERGCTLEEACELFGLENARLVIKEAPIRGE